jgi:hypothetical protein
MAGLTVLSLLPVSTGAVLESPHPDTGRVAVAQVDEMEGLDPVQQPPLPEEPIPPGAEVEVPMDEGQPVEAPVEAPAEEVPVEEVPVEEAPPAEPEQPAPPPPRTQIRPSRPTPRPIGRPGGQLPARPGLPTRGATPPLVPSPNGQDLLKRPSLPADDVTPTEPINLNFEDAELLQVLKTLGPFTGKTFDVDPGIAGQKVTIIGYDPIPPEMVYELLESVLASRGFALIPDAERRTGEGGTGAGRAGQDPAGDGRRPAGRL